MVLCDEDASLQPAVANAGVAIAADARIAIGDPFDVRPFGAELGAGPIAPALLTKAYGLALSDDLLLNPSHWRLEESRTFTLPSEDCSLSDPLG